MATREDGTAYLRLVRALAEFEKLPPPDEAASARLLEDAFGERPRYQLWVAEDGGQVVAYAVTFETYSTFRGKPSLFLEDLFVDPAARRRGVARAVLQRLREEAEQRGCGRFEWFVLDWNVNAQELYRSVGARPMSEWQLWRVDLP